MQTTTNITLTPTPNSRSNSLTQDPSGYLRVQWNQNKLSPFVGASNSNGIMVTPTPGPIDRPTPIDRHQSLRNSLGSVTPSEDDNHSVISVSTTTNNAWRAHAANSVTLPSAFNPAYHLFDDPVTAAASTLPQDVERTQLLSNSPSVLEFCILEADWNKVLQLAVKHFTQHFAPTGISTHVPDSMKRNSRALDGSSLAKALSPLDPMVFHQKYPTIPSFCTYYYPTNTSNTTATPCKNANTLGNVQYFLAASETVQKIQEQQLMFPSGIPIEIVSPTIMKYRLFGTSNSTETNCSDEAKQPMNKRRYATSQRHIIPFANTTGRALYACCYVAYEAYAIEDFIDLFDGFNEIEKEDENAYKEQAKDDKKVEEVNSLSMNGSIESGDILRDTIAKAMKDTSEQKMLTGKDAGKLILKFIYERHQQQKASAVIQRSFRRYQKIKQQRIWNGTIKISTTSSNHHVSEAGGSTLGSVKSGVMTPTRPNHHNSLNNHSNHPVPPITPVAISSANAPPLPPKSTGFLSRLFRRQSAAAHGMDGSVHGGGSSLHGGSFFGASSASHWNDSSAHGSATTNTTVTSDVSSPSRYHDSHVIGTPTITTADTAGKDKEHVMAGEKLSLDEPNALDLPAEEPQPSAATSTTTKPAKESLSKVLPFTPFSRRSMKTKDIFQSLQGKYILTQKAYCMISPLQEFPFIFQVCFIIISLTTFCVDCLTYHWCFLRCWML